MTARKIRTQELLDMLREECEREDGPYWCGEAERIVTRLTGIQFGTTFAKPRFTPLNDAPKTLDRDVVITMIKRAMRDHPDKVIDIVRRADERWQLGLNKYRVRVSFELDQFEIEQNGTSPLSGRPYFDVKRDGTPANVNEDSFISALWDAATDMAMSRMTIEVVKPGSKDVKNL